MNSPSTVPPGKTPPLSGRRPADFRSRSTLAVSVSAVILLFPFVVNNFAQSRYLLGLGSIAILALLATVGWRVYRRRRATDLVLFGLVPAILAFLFVSIRDLGIIGVLWCYPAVLSFYAMLPEGRAWIANAALLVISIPTAWGALDAEVAVRVVATLVAASCFSVIFVRVITEKNRSLEAWATVDPLTGLLNRTLLENALDQAIQLSDRTGASMTLITLDLDHFKEINDTFGHESGDKVLEGVGVILRRRLRRVDKSFRLGGEEFLALLFGAPSENGRRVAEELCDAIASLEVLPGISVTASAGVATLASGEDRAAWMRRSDQNLYRAKSNGRHQVVA